MSALTTELKRAALTPVRAVEEWLMGPADPRTYACVRIAFAVVAAAIWVDLWPVRVVLFGAEGNFGAPPAADELRLNVFQWVSSGAGVTAVFLLVAVAIVGLGLGVWQRICAVIVYVWFASYSAAASIALGGFDTVARLTSFAVAVSPVVSVLALKTRRSGVGATEGEGGESVPLGAPPPAYGLRILQWQLMLIYWVTIWLKAPDKYWREGEVISHFGVSMFARSPDPSFADIGVWDPIFTWGTLLVEFSLPLLLWKRNTRWFALVLGLLFHGGIAVVGRLGLFSLAMVPLYLAFLEREDFEGLGAVVRRLRRERVAR